MTGQCLVAAVDKAKVTLDQFTLLVLDECHHTRGGHPLRTIMNQYMELKFTPRDERVTLPQVIFFFFSKTTDPTQSVLTRLRAYLHVLLVREKVSRTGQATLFTSPWLV